MDIDKSWTTIRNRTKSADFRNGLQAFINMARPYVNDRGRIKCPCKKCLNGLTHPLEIVEAHIFRNGFAESYVTWIYHGEIDVRTANVYRQNERDGVEDEMMDVIDDVVGDEHAGTSTDGYYDELFQALHSELYPGVLSFSSLNFLVKLMHIKVMNKWTNKSVDDLLKLLKLAYPNMNLVDSHYEAKKLMTKLVWGYKSIHACKNDCALFWSEHVDRKTCPIC